MKSIQTYNAPAAIGPYSQATCKDNTLFVSGQLGIDPVTGKMAEDFTAQANLVFRHIKSILEAAGMGLSHVMKVSVFLTDMNDFATLNDIYARYFDAPYPAREAIQVARLPKDGLVEISVIAMR
ncbi:MAG: 2-iminobutanoate/2-iminopropanoate deaminase [Candidatus Cloacimonadota bacterium]|jgi:2-iminobutanoate/2-iminopropanoate deaminase|nr:2-iminobutanoate/2-iminopropanoate deaminase [Candidatus Cloacimonadota bacterium]